MKINEIQEKIDKIRNDLIVVSSELRFPNEGSPRKKRYVALKFKDSGFEIEMMFNSISKTSPVDGKRKSVPFTIDELQEKISNINKDLVITNTYVRDGGPSNRIRYVSLKWIDSDEIIEDRTLQSITKDNPKKGVAKHNAKKYTMEEYQKILDDVTNGRIKFIETFINVSTKVLFKNMECGHEFKSTPRSFMLGKLCQICGTKSHGERLVGEFLLKNNIVFETEKTFNGMIYKGKLRFDFYIEKYNLAIEFNGIQHYDETSMYCVDEDGESGLVLNQKRDAIKERYCIDNNITLIIIPYNAIVKGKLSDEILSILNNKLKINK